MSLGNWDTRAEQIFATINSVASADSVHMGFPHSSSGQTHAITELRKFGIRKPLFANARGWLQQQILANEEAYVLLSPHIRLEFAVNGQPLYWRGYGLPLDYAALHDLAEKAGSWVLEKTTPIWVGINFGVNYHPFAGQLDGLSPEGFVKPTLEMRLPDIEDDDENW